MVINKHTMLWAFRLRFVSFVGLLSVVALVSMIYCQPAMADLGQEAIDICKKWDAASPDADMSVFAQQFKQAGLTACSCTRFLTAARIAAQKEVVSAKWGLVEEDWRLIDDFIAKTARYDNKIGSMVCTVDPALNLPKTFVSDLFKRFAAAGCNNGHIYVDFDPTLGHENAATARAVIQDPNELWARIMSFMPIKNFSALLARLNSAEHSLLLGTGFNEMNDQVKNGMLLHEINGHVAHGDGILSGVLYQRIKMNNPRMQSNQFFNSIDGLHCVIENRADQVPAACGSMDDALCVQAWLQDMYEKYGDTYDKNDHDMPAKRAADVTKIVKLRQALETINK